MKVGLLALQGAFLDHIRHLEALKTGYLLVKDREALLGIDRLIIPGGESTVMARYLNAFGMAPLLRKRIRRGMPVWGICAGCILLAEKVDGIPGRLQSLPLSVERNAYGRQLASCEKDVQIPLLGRKRFPAVFIRAPKIVDMGDEITVHGRSGADPVFIQYHHIMITTFHPELTDDPVFHNYFLGL